VAINKRNATFEMVTTVIPHSDLTLSRKTKYYVSWLESFLSCDMFGDNTDMYNLLAFPDFLCNTWLLVE